MSQIDEGKKSGGGTDAGTKISAKPGKPIQRQITGVFDDSAGTPPGSPQQAVKKEPQVSIDNIENIFSILKLIFFHLCQTHSNSIIPNTYISNQQYRQAAVSLAFGIVAQNQVWQDIVVLSKHVKRKLKKRILIKWM
jgi:hypothetical protein